jgi:hypothetical protein
VWFVLRLVAIGIVLGAAIGALAGYGTYQPCTDPACFDLGRGFEVVTDAVVGAFLGLFAVPILWMLWQMGRRSTHALSRRVFHGPSTEAGWRGRYGTSPRETGSRRRRS